MSGRVRRISTLAMLIFVLVTVSVPAVIDLSEFADSHNTGSSGQSPVPSNSPLPKPPPTYSERIHAELNRVLAVYDKWLLLGAAVLIILLTHASIDLAHHGRRVTGVRAGREVEFSFWWPRTAGGQVGLGVALLLSFAAVAFDHVAIRERGSLDGLAGFINAIYWYFPLMTARWFLVIRPVLRAASRNDKTARESVIEDPPT